jgi:hypothetical protein
VRLYQYGARNGGPSYAGASTGPGAQAGATHVFGRAATGGPVSGPHAGGAQLLLLIDGAIIQVQFGDGPTAATSAQALDELLLVEQGGATQEGEKASKEAQTLQLGNEHC